VQKTGTTGGTWHTHEAIESVDMALPPIQLLHVWYPALATFILPSNINSTLLLVKMLRCPFIFSALYVLKLNRSIADTSRQSYMRIIACGIRRHQNCRIGPSLSERSEFLNRKEGNCCDLKDRPISYVIIGVFIHSLWDLN